MIAVPEGVGLLREQGYFLPSPLGTPAPSANGHPPHHRRHGYSKDPSAPSLLEGGVSYGNAAGGKGIGSQSDSEDTSMRNTLKEKHNCCRGCLFNIQ